MKTLIVLLLVLLAFIMVFTVDQPDYHILSKDQPYSQIIAEPHEWALTQFAGGPITGSEVSDHAKMVIMYGLSEADIDVSSSSGRLLLLRQDIPGRVNEVLAFRRMDQGFLYLGHFPATRVAISKDEPGILLVYEASEGHFGYIRRYKLSENGLARSSSESISVGDGAPQENNARLQKMFSVDKQVKWARTPNQSL
jgi:hypothetical protein